MHKSKEKLYILGLGFTICLLILLIVLLFKVIGLKVSYVRVIMGNVMWSCDALFWSNENVMHNSCLMLNDLIGMKWCFTSILSDYEIESTLLCCNGSYFKMIMCFTNFICSYINQLNYAKPKFKVDIIWQI